MSEIKTVWHPYPKEKPIEFTWCLITSLIGNRKVSIRMFGKTQFSIRDDEVIAWAELPEPYKEEKGNEEKKYL